MTQHNDIYRDEKNKAANEGTAYTNYKCDMYCANLHVA